MWINDLPSDILVLIFLQYNRVSNANALLLRICCLWRYTALDISNLWTRITFSPTRDGSTRSRRPPHLGSLTICRTWGALKKAIERSRNSPVHLKIRFIRESTMRETAPSFADELLVNCESLSITMGNFTAPTVFSSNISFPYLRSLDLGCGHHGKHNLHGLMQSALTNAPNLSSLRFYSDGTLSRSLVPFFDIVKTVEGVGFATPELLADIKFTNIEHIVMDKWLPGDRMDSYYGTISFPKLKSLTITHWSVLPPFQCAVLTELRIHNFGLLQPPHDLQQSQFPRLKMLTVTGDWSVLRFLNAPSVDSLTLGEPLASLQEGSLEKVVNEGSISPRMLKIDGVSELELTRLLVEKWSNIEELRWEYKMKEPVGELLRDVLCGSERLAPVPQLRRLSLEVDWRGSLLLDRSEALKMTYKCLISIKEARDKLAVTSMEEVRYGWGYIDNNLGYCHDETYVFSSSSSAPFSVSTASSVIPDFGVSSPNQPYVDLTGSFVED